MRRSLAALFALSAAGLAPGQPVVPPPPPPPPILQADNAGGVIVQPGMTVRQKVYQSQLVAAGTVGLGKETLDAAMYPGQGVPKTTYKVAALKVSQALIGDKVDGTLKILIPPADPAQMPFEQPGRKQPYFRPTVSQVQLIDGQEGVFFLAPHPTAAGYYHIPYGQTPLNPLDTTYKADLAVVKKIAATYADPLAALKAKDAADRFEAAAALVHKYRRQAFTQGGKPPQQVAIPAEESKLILTAIGEADWAQYDRPRVGSDPPPDYTLMPNSLLAQLGVSPGQHGMPQLQVNAGRGYNETYHELYKTWLEGEGAKFEVKKFVTEKK